MEFENYANLAREANPAEFSLDSNTFERTLILDRLGDIRSRIHSEKELDSEDAWEILDAMDKLAAIGYFCSSDAEANVSEDDWRRRGIEPRDQFKIESDLMHQNMQAFEALLEEIYTAEIKPAGFINMIYQKTERQNEEGVSGANYIIDRLKYFNLKYPQE